MIVGIPKGLLYCRYSDFFNTFFKKLNVKVVISNDTNSDILNLGVRYCVNEACLPVKVFHGHVASIKDNCDMILIPRFMSIRKDECICPKFCGLPEMVKNSIQDLPPIISEPIYADSEFNFYKWAKKTGNMITKDQNLIKSAFSEALLKHNNLKRKQNTENRGKINIAIIGHPYNVSDSFVNMDVKKKLIKQGFGILTDEDAKESSIEMEVKKLFKKPFWTFARNSYGAAVSFAKSGKADGIIYISSFGCGIDSIVIELIKLVLPDFPVLVLKVDEQTGEAGIDTRIEAFSDMLLRRKTA